MAEQEELHRRSIETNDHPRRRGIKRDQAVVNFGNQVEYAMPLDHEAARMCSTILRHWGERDVDLGMRLIRLAWRARQIVRGHQQGKLLGFWRHFKRRELELIAQPVLDLSTPVEETNPLLPIPTIRPRSPYRKKGA
jgi:hypothetical protein